MICSCTSSGANKSASAYVRRSDGIWAHGKCRMPTKLYLESFMAIEQERVMTHLNILQGGPLHNTFISNAELFDRVGIRVREDADLILEHVDRYRYTDGTITGQSGKIARIWVYKEN